MLCAIVIHWIFYEQTGRLLNYPVRLLMALEKNYDKANGEDERGKSEAD